MIAYWRFDEGMGNIAADTAHPLNPHVKNIETDQFQQSYGQYPASIYGATWGGGYLDNYALYFDGRAKVISQLPIPISNTFTISAWVNPTAETVNTKYAYLRIIETAYDIGIYLGTDMTGTKYKLIINSGSGSTGTCGSAFGCAEGGNLVAGVWNLITATFDGRIGKLYINGNLSASDTFNFTPTIPMPVHIGQYVYYPDAGYGWRGGIDDVRIYPRSLSAEEVLALFNQVSNYRLPPVLISGMNCHESSFLGHGTRTLTCALKTKSKVFRGTLQVKLAPKDQEIEQDPLNYAWPVFMQADGNYALNAVGIYDRNSNPRAVLGTDFYGFNYSAIWNQYPNPEVVTQVRDITHPCPAEIPCQEGLYPYPLAITELRCEITWIDAENQSVTCGIAANLNTYSGTLRIVDINGLNDDQRVAITQPVIEGELQYWGVIGVIHGVSPIEHIEFITESPIANWTPAKTTPYPPETTSQNSFWCKYFHIFCRRQRPHKTKSASEVKYNFAEYERRTSTGINSVQKSIYSQIEKVGTRRRGQLNWESPLN